LIRLRTRFFRPVSRGGGLGWKALKFKLGMDAGRTSNAAISRVKAGSDADCDRCQPVWEFGEAIDAVRSCRRDFAVVPKSLSSGLIILGHRKVADPATLRVATGEHGTTA